MAQSPEKLPTDLSWQLTTTTIWCPQVKLRVTLIVKEDWTTYCCWYEEQKQDKRTLETRGCEGPECSYIKAYRDKLVAEEMNN